MQVPRKPPMSTIPTTGTEEACEAHLSPRLSKAKRGSMCKIPLGKGFPEKRRNFYGKSYLIFIQAFVSSLNRPYLWWRSLSFPNLGQNLSKLRPLQPIDKRYF